MALTRDFVASVMEPYLAGDFEGFVRQKCTPDFTYDLVPGDIASKLGLAGPAQQHEFAGIFKGHDAAVKMILEGLTGREVKNLKIGARVLKTVVDAEDRSAALEVELFGDAKRTDKPFILANAIFLTFDENLKITYWSDHLDTFTLAK